MCLRQGNTSPDGSRAGQQQRSVLDLLSRGWGGQVGRAQSRELGTTEVPPPRPALGRFAASWRSFPPKRRSSAALAACGSPRGGRRQRELEGQRRGPSGRRRQRRREESKEDEVVTLRRRASRCPRGRRVSSPGSSHRKRGPNAHRVPRSGSVASLCCASRRAHAAAAEMFALPLGVGRARLGL